jgi:hypothetical protein
VVSVLVSNGGCTVENSATNLFVRVSYNRSPVLTIMKLHDFLVARAMFPFPHPIDDRTAGTTDVSQFEVALLEREWKAGHAVRDEALVKKLCQALEDILGDTPAGAEDYLLASFSPQLQADELGTDGEWDTNPSEVQVSI